MEKNATTATETAQTGDISPSMGIHSLIGVACEYTALGISMIRSGGKKYLTWY